MGQGYFKQKPMKTAMQELRDSINTSYTHMTMARETKDIYIYKLALKEALDKIDALLEKEKEQMQLEFSKGYDFATNEAVKEITKNYKPNL